MYMDAIDLLIPRQTVAGQSDYVNVAAPQNKASSFLVYAGIMREFVCNQHDDADSRLVRLWCVRRMTVRI